MFEDQKPAAGAPPANLPASSAEPVDMFADVETKVMPDMTPKAPAPHAPIQSGAPVQPKNPPPSGALSAGLLKKKEPMFGIPAAPGFDDQVGVINDSSVYKMKSPIAGKVILALLVVGALLSGGWWVYANYISIGPDKTTPTPPAKEFKTDEPTAPAPAAVVLPSSSEQVIPPVVGTSTDSASSNVANDIKSDKILFGQGVDSDHDGLDNAREKQLGTDPDKADTDGDGLSDGDEVLIWKTDPLNPDTDGDGFPDGKEVRNGYNPLGPGKLFTAPTTTKS